MNKGEIRKTPAVGGKANPTRTAAPPAAATTARTAVHPVQPAVDPQVFIKVTKNYFLITKDSRTE